MDTKPRNCDTASGSRRGSFNTTICVLECLREYERVFGPRTSLTEAKDAGEAYLLERHMFKQRSTGTPITVDRKSGLGSDEAPAFQQLAYPNWWHYDILRGKRRPDGFLSLEFFRVVGTMPKMSGRNPFKKINDRLRINLKSFLAVL